MPNSTEESGTSKMKFGQLGRRVGGRLDGGRQLVATGPVIHTGEMVAEYHKHYG
nr:hypothetical protein [Rhodoferax sp.]